jgi:hypothetical protein
VDTGAGSPLTFTGTELNNNIIQLGSAATITFNDGSTLDAGSSVVVTSGTIVTNGTFNDIGTIVDSDAGSVLTLVNNGTIVSSGLTSDIGIETGAPGDTSGGTVIVTGGSFSGDGLHVNGGTLFATTALDSSDAVSVDGGLADVTLTNKAAAPTLVYVGAQFPSTIKLENPTAYDSGTQLQGFVSGDTLDIGSNIVGTLIYSANTGYGNLTLEDSKGNTIFSAVASGGDVGSFTSSTTTINATGTTVAGNFQVIQGAGDTLITEAGSSGPTSGPTTWSWNGGSGSFEDSAQWTNAGGLGNASGFPLNGDSATIGSGSASMMTDAVDLVSLTIGSGSAASLSVGLFSQMQVNDGLVIGGDSTLTVDGVSGVDLGTSGTFSLGAVQVDNGSILSGNGTVAAAVVNNGQVLAADGALELTSSVSGVGALLIGGSDMLTVDGTLGAGQSIGFNSAGSGETLALQTPGSGLSNAITGFGVGDKIDFGNGMTITAASVVNGNTIALDYTSGSGSGTYDLTNVAFAGGANVTLGVGTDSSNKDSFVQVTGTVTTGITVRTPSDFVGNGISDILFRDNATGDTGYVAPANGGTPASWTGFTTNTDYSVAAIGDFSGSGTAQILFRDNANGAEGYLVPATSGHAASWVNLGVSSSAYSVVGSGDLTGTNRDSVLFENLSNGSLGYFTLGNSGPNTWQSLGTPSLLYSVAGVGDLDGNGTADIMFRNNSTGQEGYYSMPRGGGQASWVGLGTSSTAYSVIGIGDFDGNSSGEILFRNGSNGDWGFVTPANGGNSATWTDIGASNTAYTAVQIGDFDGKGMSDVLFRNNANGDYGYWAPASGGSGASWHDIGISSTAYAVMASPTYSGPTSLPV